MNLSYGKQTQASYVAVHLFVFICLSVIYNQSTKVGGSATSDAGVSTIDAEDRKFNYTRVFVTIYMVHWQLNFEMPGQRVMEKRWSGVGKILMLHFKAAGHTKYGLEAMRLQFQLQVLSSSLAHQIMHHHSVNTRGGLGNNIPCDLYNEHVNKQVKIIIQNMGSNLTEVSLQRAVQCVSILHALCKRFDAASQVSAVTSAHSTKVLSVNLHYNLLKKKESTTSFQ